MASLYENSLLRKYRSNLPCHLSLRSRVFSETLGPLPKQRIGSGKPPDSHSVKQRTHGDSDSLIHAMHQGIFINYDDFLWHNASFNAHRLLGIEALEPVL